MDQKTLARWLKAVIIGTGICGLVVFLWLVPFMGKGVLEGYPEFGSWYLPWLIFLEISGLPCFGVLYLGWRIAGNIGQDRSFSMENASFLKKIAYCAAGRSFPSGGKGGEASGRERAYDLRKERLWKMRLFSTSM